MDLQDLQKRTRLGRDLLRYCVDSELVPRTSIRSAGAGKPRKFDVATALLITVAALLVETGIPPRQVRLMINSLRGFKDSRHGSGTRILHQVIVRRVAADVAWGDGRYVQFRVPDLQIATNWHPMADPNGPFYFDIPMVRVEIDLWAVAERIWPQIPEP